ncbi:hypothetical protein GCK72_022315 [Caenorhabditis remanei]|uniref:Uncharacterized protein n=1 Tax=Caenorhabditis remanei TaxID=31234 RepID=A0A6A5FTE3_CAERE|nr:hypothetical protein GCK72_022315 [Caenorhabditis remanei]KAF1745868.1 hypothetical protein GCK72_022315 [Caenorhabditis remanei]
MILNPVYDLSLFQISTIFYQLQILPDEEVLKELLKKSDEIDRRFIEWVTSTSEKTKDTPSCSSSVVVNLSDPNSPDRKRRKTLS